MNDIAESPDRARSKAELLLDFIIGSFKVLVILSPAWLLVLSFLGGTGDCRGDCGVGMGMLFIVIVVYLGPALLVIGIPIVLGLLIWWTKGRPAQLVGGIALIPLLLTAWSGFGYIRDTVASSKIEAGIRPEYLSRTVAKPVGRLELLLLVGEGGGCFENCYQILANGISLKYSNGHLNNNGGSQKFFEKTFSLATGENCLSKENSVQDSIEYLQSRGIFNACVVNARVDPPITAVALRGFQYDRNVLARPYGLRGVQVLQAVTDGMLGEELIRWEYGSLPGTQKRIGTPVQWNDLIRAYTGISTDRFAETQKLDHSQRMDAILRSEESPPLQLYPVFSYLRGAPDAYRYTGREEKRQKLTDDAITKLLTICKRICTATPIVKGYSSKPIDCLKGYNELVRSAYPGQANELTLANG